MKVGLQIPYFTWPGGAVEMGGKLAHIARTAEDAGFDSAWVMDHYFQIPMVGPVEADMLEAYTTLGYLAGHTKRLTLGTMVTGVTYRHPGILVKQVTTLDVLSGGRAWLGIGGAWFDREHEGLGVPFPPLKE
ncbi:MAG TPA: LLM class flavin-dependent oxidoreductase, partial [Dehalococcoidia bacterium]